MTSPEVETEHRLAARAAHEELRLQLGVARHRLIGARDVARESYEAALSVFLTSPDDADVAEAVATASTRLAAAEHLFEDVSQRLDANKRVAVR